MTLLYASLYPAAPYGLETQLSYNGLTLNTGKFAATIARDGGAYYVTAIGGLDDADVRYSETPRPDMDGVLTGISYHGSRTITIEGYIVGMNMEKLRVYQQNLREAFAQNINTEKSLVFLTGDATNGDVYINCRKSSSLVMREALPTQVSRFARRDFLVTLKASDPRFLSVFQASTGVFNASTGSVITAQNKGNYSSYPQITVRGPFSAGLTLTNNITNSVLRLDTAVGFSDLVLNMQTKRVTLGGANAFGYLDPTSQWVSLEPGTQSLTLGGVAGVTTVSAVWANFNHSWM